jgi:hypothetical protein
LTDSLAFALEAHEGQPPPKERKERKGLAALATLCLGDGDLDDNLDDAADDAMDTDDEELATDKKQTETPQESYHNRVKDCPISYSAAAMRRSIPAALLALNDTYDDPALLRRLSRLTSRIESRVAHAHTPLPGHPKASEAADKSEADAASATGSTHCPAATTALESSSDEPAVADPVAESDQPAAAAEGASATATADASAQPATDEPADAEPAAEPATEPAAAAVTSRAVWSIADGYGARSTLVDGYGARSTLVDGYGARGTPSPVATSVAEPVAEPRHVADGEHKAPARASTDAPRVPVARIWATLLAIKVLEGMDVCWLVDDEAQEGEERTIVDAAREWLEAQGAADPRVGALLDGGELSTAAVKTIDVWRKVLENNIAAVRSLDVLNRFTALTHFQRATARVIKSVMTDHGAVHEALHASLCADAARRSTETFATFLDADGYIMRWQRFSAHSLCVLCPHRACVLTRFARLQ